MTININRVYYVVRSGYDFIYRNHHLNVIQSFPGSYSICSEDKNELGTIKFSLLKRVVKICYSSGEECSIYSEGILHPILKCDFRGSQYKLIYQKGYTHIINRNEKQIAFTERDFNVIGYSKDYIIQSDDKEDWLFISLLSLVAELKNMPFGVK